MCIRDSGRLKYPDVPHWRAPSSQERHATTARKAGQRPPASGDRCRGATGDPAPYVAIDRRDAIQPAFDALLGVVDQVLAVDRAVAERAKEIVLGRRQISARDAVHLAVMEQHGIEQILTFDSGFDGFPGIKRLS